MYAKRKSGFVPATSMGGREALQFEALTQAAAEVAERAASIIAERSRKAFKERGRFTIALSGGPSASQMIRCLGKKEVPWGRVFVFEVSEPIPPEGHPALYFPKLREALVEDTPLDPRHIYPMPVSSTDPLAATRTYARRLKEFAGSPPVIDLIYLGLETDTCSVEGRSEVPILQVTGDDVGIVAHQGQKRMILTYHVFERARQILWIVKETDEANARFQLRRLPRPFMI